MTTSRRPDITPDTKVGALLEQYPEIEATLIGISPEFRRLKNPVLRRTVAKVATLRQVAAVGGTPLGPLVARLREAAGLDPLPASEGGEAAGSASARPGWAGTPTHSYDARPVIDGGGQPVERVLKDLAKLGSGEVYELVTPFVPAPLIDIARGKGFLSWTAPPEAGAVRTLFTRDPAPAAPRA